MSSAPARIPIASPAQAVMTRIAAYHGVTVPDLKGARRDPKAVTARHHAAYELRKLALSLPTIGRLLGGRDHTTILEAIRRWPDRASRLGISMESER